MLRVAAASSVHLFDVVRHVLNKAADYVLARWSHRRVDDRRDDHIYVGPLRKVAVLGLVVSLFQGIECSAQWQYRHRGADLHRAAGKIGQPVDSEVHLAGAATEFVVSQLRSDFAIQMLFPDQTQVGSPRVESGYDRISSNLVTISSATPTALPFLMMTLLTPASVIISAP